MNDLSGLTIDQLALAVGEERLPLDTVLAECRRRQRMLDAAEVARLPELEGEWEVADYDEQQIEIMAHKEMHVAFLNNTTTGRRFAQHIVDLHNAAYRAAKGNS